MPKTLKIAMVCHVYPLNSDDLGTGVGMGTRTLCNALQQTDELDVTVLRPMAPVRSQERFKLNDVTIYALPRGHDLPPGNQVLIQPVRLLRRILAELQPDITHIQDSAWIARWLPNPKIFTLRGLVERDMQFEPSIIKQCIKSSVLSLTNKWARRSIDNFIAISPWALEQLPKNPHRRAWHIPNPLSDDWYETRREPQNYRFFSACRIRPLKNVHTLICGFANIATQEKTAQLRIAGDADDKRYLESCKALAHELGLGDRVHFLGWLSPEQTRQELARASVFVLPSLHENTPMTIIEAMAVGVPVVAAAVGGIPWMLENGESGWLLATPENTNELAHAMDEANMMRNDKKMTVKIRGRAKIFKASTVARQTIKAYRDCLPPK